MSITMKSWTRCAAVRSNRAWCSAKLDSPLQAGPVTSARPSGLVAAQRRQQQHWPDHQQLLSTQRLTLCHDSNASQQDTASNNSGTDNQPAGNGSGLAVNAVLLALWAGLMGYVFLLAPNQTPTIDAFTVQKLVGMKVDDPFQVNQVFTAIWNCMGLYPLIYAAILIPGARTNKLPAWPFVCTSVFLGAYALIPYMCLWSPKSPAEQLPPPESELEGWDKFYMRAAETRWLPLGLLAGSAYWVYTGLAAGLDQWMGYVQLFDESRLVHATSLDFMLCTLLMYFWMSNDAEGRNWDKRDTLVPLLSLLPLVGPSTYLLLRPKTYDS